MNQELKQTCTDLLIQAMDKIDDMESVIVIYKVKDAGEGNSGVEWYSNTTTFEALAMMEMTKAGLLFRE